MGLELDGKNEKFFEIDDYKVAIKRIPDMGHLCGYVALKDKVYKKKGSWQNVIECHGGITFKGSIYGLPGYCIGFDCAHAFDLVPGLKEFDVIESDYMPSPVYRDEEYVTNELKSIVEQLKELE